jgi:hypothetical protein
MYMCLGLREKGSEDSTFVSRIVLLLKLEMKAKGRYFWNSVWLESIKDNDFHGATEASKKWLDLCILSLGDYFEGDGGQME